MSNNESRNGVRFAALSAAGITALFVGAAGASAVLSPNSADLPQQAEVPGRTFEIMPVGCISPGVKFREFPGIGQLPTLHPKDPGYWDDPRNDPRYNPPTSTTTSGGGDTPVQGTSTSSSGHGGGGGGGGASE